MTVTATAITASVGGTLGGLITQCRDLSRDLDTGEATELLTSDTEFIRYFVEAEDEIARRTYCLNDTTSSTCNVTLVTDQAPYTISAKILRVDTVTLPATSTFSIVKLRDSQRVSRKWLNNNLDGWNTMDEGQPIYFFQEERKITFVPAPDSTYSALTATMETIRRPTTVLSLSNLTPEIPELYYQDMVNYVLFKVYGKKDSQIFNDKESLTYYSLFVSSVGERPTGQQERIIKEEPIDLCITPGFSR